jgi:DNA modification methylase
MIIRGNALALPLRDACVDLIVTSPPYFALRSYRDGDEHYEGQLGSEETPGAFVDALIETTREMVRVLKPTGSIFVNLGDKYAGSGGHNNGGLTGATSSLKNPNRAADRTRIDQATRRNAADRYNQNSDGIRPKSLMGLPWRYAIGCVDQLGLILRRDLIWHKPNGLPESVTDRCRTSHEYWFHLTKRGRYFTALDEIREPHKYPDHHQNGTTVIRTRPASQEPGDEALRDNGGVFHSRESFRALDPRGKVPGSVWTVPSEPLMVPDVVRDHYDLPDHFAAFPQEWPRRLILGWSPSGICTACGEGRRPVTEKTEELDHESPGRAGGKRRDATEPDSNGRGYNAPGRAVTRTAAIITGYACACDVPIAPTRPAVVLDPFGGTGTVAMVARALGRTGINADLSGDYCRLARWRIYESGHAAKSEERTWRDAQGAML